MNIIEKNSPFFSVFIACRYFLCKRGSFIPRVPDVDKGQIIAKISDHIRTRGGVPHDWYIGISQFPEWRLLTGHKVDMEKDKWILIPSNSDQEAKAILDYFVNWIGTDGEPGEETNGARRVYAYKKAPHTEP